MCLFVVLGFEKKRLGVKLIDYFVLFFRWVGDKYNFKCWKFVRRDKINDIW